MVRYTYEKTEAISLRKQGFSYSEILQKIPVAKSTLSLWLREVGLAKRVVQKLTEKKLAGALRGALAKKNKRIFLSQQIYEEAEKEVQRITQRELWLMGVILYWAEGSKEKEGDPSSRVQFMNHDPFTIRLFLKWLNEICNIKNNEIGLDIYIHEYKRPQIDKVKEYWSQQTGFPKSKFIHVYYKKNNLNPRRKNIGDNYFGGLKVNVYKSSILNRKIRGWFQGVCKNCRVV